MALELVEQIQLIYKKSTLSLSFIEGNSSTVSKVQGLYPEGCFHLHTVSNVDNNKTVLSG